MAAAFDDAALQYMELALAPITAYPLWIAARAYTDDITINQFCVFLGGTSDTLWKAHLGLACAVANDPTRAGSSATVMAAINTTPNATWMSLLGVYAHTASRVLYRDASTASNATASVPATPTVLSLGRRGSTTPTQYLSGRLAEVAVGSGIPTAADAALLAAGYSPLCLSVPMVAYWPLIAASVEDWFGRYDLTNNGATSVAHPTVTYPIMPYTLRGETGGRADMKRWILGWNTDPTGTARVRIPDGILRGRIYRVVRDPRGGRAPTAAYTIKLNNLAGKDMLAGLPGAGSATASEETDIYDALSAGDYAKRAISGIHELLVESAGMNRSGTVVIETVSP